MTLPDRTGWMTGALASAPSCPPFPNFTSFEQAVLDKVAPAFDSDESIFRAQVLAARVTDRINSSVGFFTRVQTDRSRLPKLSLESPAMFQTNVEGIKNGLGFLIWFNNGYVEDLEGFLNLSERDTLEGVNLADLRLKALLNEGRRIEVATKV